MKKWLFLSLISVLLLFLLSTYYFVRYHGEEILEVSTEKLVELSLNKFYGDLENVENSIYIDSLKIQLENYFTEINILNIDEQLNKIEELSDAFDVILMDSQIDSVEFSFIKRRLVIYE